MKPEDICVRVLNHYRHYDVLAYLGLRYYLHSAAARSDFWAQQLATDVVLTGDGAHYLYGEHFKEFDETGKIKHRSIYIPGPNEALAEAALLSECASHDTFLNPDYIFSYALNKEDRRGVYKNYMDGLRDRHEAIARACRDCPNGIVAYTDIKNFYPSITTELAMRIWRKKGNIAGLSEIYLNLGERLLSNHGQASGGTSSHIVIGPMFSHFMANLVLRELDEEFIALPVKYFRYVDDITLVGGKDEIKKSIQIIRDRLQQEFNLDLHEEHSPKNITLPVSEWLKGKDDFKKNEISHDWMVFISDLKRFILYNPKHCEAAKTQFAKNGFRISFLNYNIAIRERGYIERIWFLLKKSWFRAKINSISVDSLLDAAISIRNKCETVFHELANDAKKLSGFERKRCIPKLRYCAGRLIYLATDDTLKSLAKLAREIPELHIYAEIMQTVYSGQIDNILPLGVNAAQMAAQPLKAANKRGLLTKPDLSLSEQHVLSVFFLNGVNISIPENIPSEYSDILRFAITGSDSKLMKQLANPIIREFACLHGIGSPRHSITLETAFDIDEDLAMDALEHPWQSS